MAILRPEEHKRMGMQHILYAKEEIERRKKAPVHVRAEEIAQQFREHHHVYIVDPRLGFNQRTFRFWINRLPPKDSPEPRKKKLGHRHTVEAVIYMVRGRGYSVIDGKRYDWQGGDFLCVPVFAWHVHFPDESEEWVDLAATTGPFSMAMGIAIYEDERYPEHWVFAQKEREAEKTLIPGESEVSDEERRALKTDMERWRPEQQKNPQAPGALYYEQVTYSQHEETRRRQGRVLVKGSDLKFGPTAMGRLAYVVDPRLGFNVKLLTTLVAEIPPAKRSGAHRHVYEEVNYVLSGSGYSIIEDQRYEWKQGDVFVIPVFGWHQHFNTGKETARFLVHTSRAAMESTGYVHTQQGEPADYE